MGTNINLEQLGVTLSKVNLSYASEDLEDLGIETGLQIGGEATFLGVTGTTKFTLDLSESPVSTIISIEIEGDEFQKVGKCVTSCVIV